MSIFTRILLACILPLVIIFSAIIVLINTIVGAQITAAAEEKLENLAIETARQIDDRFLNARSMLDVMGVFLSEIDNTIPGADEIAASRVRSMLVSAPYVRSMWFSFEPHEFVEGERFSRDFVRDESGIRALTDFDDASVLYDSILAPWYYYPFRTGKLWFETADYYDYQLGTGRKFVGTVSAPIIRNGMTAGVAGVDLLYENTFEFINKKKVQDKQLILVLTEDGKIIYSQDTTLINRSIFDMRFESRHYVQSQLLKNAAFDIQEISPFLGVRSNIYFYPIVSMPVRSKQLYLYIDLPTDALFSDADNISRIVTSASVVGLLLFTIILSFTISGILRPIKNLTKSANMIAEKDVDIKFDMILNAELSEEKTKTRNEFHNLFAALRNIGESIAMTEKYKAMSGAKSDFLAKMSHEIRTPLNAITGMAELALREDMPPAVREHVLTIKQAGANLLSIINDTLDLSKIESGKLEIIPVEYHLASLINDVVSIIRTRLIDSPVQFVVDINNDIPSVLFGDEVRIRQVLLNMLNNAVKYTKEGSITLSINGEASESIVTLVMEVTDTGKGIREEDIGKLFGDFVQVDTKANRGIEGTGLGLSIARGLVRAMDGEIGVKSVYGMGSTFTVTLPQKIRSHEPLSKVTFDAPADYTEVKFNAPDARVLVVDDIKTNLEVAKGLLSPYEMTVDTCLSGAEAITMVRLHNYDLVLMDHMMPEMDGLEATMKIREMGSVYAHIPIIALTANAVAGTREMLLQNGFDDFLSKPIDTAKMNALLEKWIPEEKQEAAATRRFEIGEVMDAGIAIEGVDVRAGMARVGGSMTAYRRTLSVFSSDGREKIGEIKKHLAADDTRQLTICVHALKGAAANIGAAALAEAAKALELAGKREDRQFIKRNAGRMLDDLETLLRNIDAAVAAESEKRGQARIDRDAIRKTLVNLNAAIDGFDIDAINTAASELRLLAGAGGEIESVLQKTLIGEHDEAVALIEKLLERKAWSNGTEA